MTAPFDQGEASPPNGHQSTCTWMNSDYSRWPNLRLHIPQQCLIDSDPSGKPPLSPRMNATAGGNIPSSGKGSAPRPSFKSRVAAATSGSSCSSSPSRRSSSILMIKDPSPRACRSSLFDPVPHAAAAPPANPGLGMTAARRTTSLPVSPVMPCDMIDILESSLDDLAPETKLLTTKLDRSLSLQSSSSARNSITAVGCGGFLLVRHASGVRLERARSPSTPVREIIARAATPSPKQGDGQEIPLEQAVCRICLDELGEGSSTFHLECSCKGELALAHEECTLKWFGIKGNKTCDVCNQDVQNLPVTLHRLNSDDPQAQQQQQTQEQLQPSVVMPERLWHDIPVLIMISMLAYFCLLEQLLVRDMGSGALAIALPFSCILGLLASVTATTLVNRKFIWAYAALQFGLVILFAHIFYRLMPRMLQVHVEAVLSIVLAAFAGFGIAMGVNGAVLELLTWRRARRRRRHNATGGGDDDVELQEP